MFKDIKEDKEQKKSEKDKEPYTREDYPEFDEELKSEMNNKLAVDTLDLNNCKTKLLLKGINVIDVLNQTNFDEDLLPLLASESASARRSRLQREKEA